MRNFLSGYWIQIGVAVTTGLIIYLFPIIKNDGSASSAHEFRSAFGYVGAISFITYICAFFVFSALVKYFQLSKLFVYLAHVLAIIIGYSIFIAAYQSIAAGGIPSIF